MINIIRVRNNILYMTQIMQICTKCKRELPATTDFFNYSKREYKGKRYNEGLRYQCKDCWNKYKREHREQVVKSRKEYKEKNLDRDKIYNKTHQKIRKLKPKQDFCSICNQKRKLELSSINGNYSENINDYWWLCHECHHLFDRINKTHIIVT